MAQTSKVSEAFKEPANAIGLAGVLALAAGFLTPIPLIVGLVAEAAYLLFVPDSKWFDRRLSAKYDAEIDARRKKLKDQVLPTLAPEMRDRYLRLETTRDQIYAQCDDGRPWFREVLRKLDFLLEKFLLFGSKEVQFGNYLASVLDEVTREDTAAQSRQAMPKRRVPPVVAPDEPVVSPENNWVKQTVARIQECYDAELQRISTFLDQSQEVELHTKAVLEKRQEVMQRRKEYVSRIGAILTNLSHQSRLMEDTFGLINDEIRARSPEQVLADIEDVVFQTNAMNAALEEVAPFEQMTVPVSA
jgi:hypothetical protein